MAKKKPEPSEAEEQTVESAPSVEEAKQMLRERKDLAAVMTDEGWVTRDNL